MIIFVELGKAMAMELGDILYAFVKLVYYKLFPYIKF